MEQGLFGEVAEVVEVVEKNVVEVRRLLVLAATSFEDWEGGCAACVCLVLSVVLSLKTENSLKQQRSLHIRAKCFQPSYF